MKQALLYYFTVVVFSSSFVLFGGSSVYFSYPNLSLLAFWNGIIRVRAVYETPRAIQSKKTISIHLKAFADLGPRSFKNARKLGLSGPRISMWPAGSFQDSLPLISGDSVIEIQVVSTEVWVCQEEGESDRYPPVIWATQPWIKHAILHHWEGYLIILSLLQTTNMASFYSCQGLLFITFSSLVGTSALCIATSGCR